MKKILLAAVAALFIFTSCNKEGIDNPVLTGENALLGLVIEFPAVSTKAADANATADEVKITDVTIYVFNTDGSIVGAPVTKAISAFTPGTGANINTYVLNENERLTVTAGAKHIYVGANLPSQIKSLTSETALKTAVATTNLVTANGIAMFSGLKEQTLSAQEVNSTPTVNTAQVSIARLVAKISANAGTAANATANLGDATVGEYEVTPDMYSVGNLASAIFPVQQFSGTKLLTPMTNTTAIGSLISLNANGTAANVASKFYVPEHRPQSNLRGEGTFIVIRGSFDFDSYATLNAAGTGVELNASTYSAGDHFWVVRTSDNSATYFCETAQDAVNVASITANALTPAEFAGKYCFYYMFINNSDTLTPNRVTVFRNTFIHYTIGAVKGLGYPGDLNDPENPTTEIPEPDEPIFATDAYLLVDISVTPWTYTGVTLELE